MVEINRAAGNGTRCRGCRIRQPAEVGDDGREPQTPWQHAGSAEIEVVATDVCWPHITTQIERVGSLRLGRSQNETATGIVIVSIAQRVCRLHGVATLAGVFPTDLQAVDLEVARVRKR